VYRVTYDDGVVAFKMGSRLAEVCVGFEGGFGPKGLGNLAQALAWVALQ